MNARELLAKSGGKDLVCVVRYIPAFFRMVDKNGQEVMINPPQNPAVLMQVTLKAGKVKGDMVRLGDTAGDEIVGWQWMDGLEVVSVLGEMQWDGKTVEPLDDKEELLCGVGNPQPWKPYVKWLSPEDTKFEG